MPDHLGNEFHDYRLIWTESFITLQVDGLDYGRIDTGFKNNLKLNDKTEPMKFENKNRKSPFDKEV